MNVRDRAKLRKQRTRENYQTRVNLRADEAARTPYIQGRYAGFNVDARSVRLRTPEGGTVLGVSVTSRTLGRRFSVQRVRGGKDFAL